MKHFELFLIAIQFTFFAVILSNMARLVADYLTSKIK